MWVWMCWEGEREQEGVEMIRDKADDWGLCRQGLA